MKKILTWLVALGLSTVAASATSLSVVNAGFDADPLPDGGFTCSGTVGFTGWHSFNSNCGTGLLNPPTSAYAGGLAPSGNNVAYENGPAGYWQALTSTYQAGDTVTFSILVGHRLDISFAGYTLELYAGNTPIGTPIASISNAVNPAAGVFLPTSVSYTVTNPALVGQNIIVAFKGGSNIGIQTNFDNAAVDATNAPEPGTYALIGATLVPIAMMRRKRRAA